LGLDILHPGLGQAVHPQRHPVMRAFYVVGIGATWVVVIHASPNRCRRRRPRCCRDLRALARANSRRSCFLFRQCSSDRNLGLGWVHVPGNGGRCPTDSPTKEYQKDEVPDSVVTSCFHHCRCHGPMAWLASSHANALEMGPPTALHVSKPLVDGESACRRDSVQPLRALVAIHLSGLPGEAPLSRGGRAARFPRLALLRVGFTEPVKLP
jgi:hypothetical protein